MLDQSPFSLPKPPAAENDIAFASRRLRQAFIRCELVPGTYAHEGDLAQRFGLGRAAVRVALTELATAGFVARHARQGWRVAAIDGALASAIVEAQQRIEPALIEKPLDERSIALLGSLRGALDAVIGRDDPSARAMAQQPRLRQVEHEAHALIGHHQHAAAMSRRLVEGDAAVGRTEIARDGGADRRAHEVRSISAPAPWKSRAPNGCA